MRKLLGIITVAGLLLASCDKAIEHEITKKANTQLQPSQEKIDLLESMNLPTGHNAGSRTPITYAGQLCPDAPVTGTAIPFSYGIPSQWTYYYFHANAGDVVTIDGDRTPSCNMDPAFHLIDGLVSNTDDAGSWTYLAFADDNTSPACTPSCFSFGDPLLSGYVIPATGDYTVAIFDFLGCSEDARTYSLSISGITCTIVIDGCDTGVPNMEVDGMSMMDWILECAENASNHGQFVSCVAALTNAWKAAGYITGAQKGAIQSCAAESSWPI